MGTQHHLTSDTNTPAWEKILGMCGLLLLLFGFSYLGWTAFEETESPPSVIFNIVKTTPLDDGFLVEVEVANSGSRSMAALNLEGHLRTDHTRETRYAQVDYLPSRSKSYVGFFFSANPHTGTLTFQPSGYQKP